MYGFWVACVCYMELQMSADSRGAVFLLGSQLTKKWHEDITNYESSALA